MKLFDENERYTPEAIAFTQAVRAAVEPLFKQYAANGAKLRELEYLAEQEVQLLALQSLVSKR